MSEIYLDPSKKVEERVNDLLSKMTFEEKIGQMMQVAYSEVTTDEAKDWAKKGAGSFLHVLGDNARELQEIAKQTRLGIPIIFGIDAIHGHGLNENATIFPSQLASACTWNPDLIEEMGRITAREVATDGLHWTFSPVLCLGRDTRWGRIDETFGEDPYLTGELGAAIIKGYQGDDLSHDESILACAKHYIGYGEAVGARDSCDTQMTFRKMRETFLPPFKKAVEAGCATVMTAYGSIDGTPFTASEKSLKTILKEELGFNGFVVTDWDNVNGLINNQHVAKDIDEASYLSFKAGNDMIMKSLDFYEAAIKLVKSGKLDEKILDEAVTRILRIKFAQGLFEKPEKKGKPKCFGCEEHLLVNKKITKQTIVLLENNGILPFKDNIKKIAVIGPNADDIRAQYGDWTYFTHPKPNPNHKAIRPYYTVLDGIKEIAKDKNIEVIYGEGNSIDNCDAIVLVLGDMIDEFGETKDRADLSLKKSQNELFNKVKSLNIPIITVLVASKPLCIGNLKDGSEALICAFNGGMFGGLAVSEVIFGKVNPSGKLPISFPRHSGQIPVYYNYLPGWHGGKYCDLDETPLYSFGEGLSYTTFEYSNLTVDDNLNVSVTIKNTGSISGDEIVQVYFRDCVSSVITPVKQLIRFKRITLSPNEVKKVTFKLKNEDFSLITPDEKQVTEPGEFIIMVGSDSVKCENLTQIIEL